MNFKKIILSAILAVITVTGVQAQLLWKISGNGLSKPSYIMGTHHVAPVSVLDSVAGFTPALAKVDKLYGEVVMSEMARPETMMKMQQKMMAPQGKQLSDLLSPAQLDSLQTVLRKFMGDQVNVAMFNAMTPSALLVQLTLLESMKIFPDFNPEQQLDTDAQNRALALGKPVGGLESIDLQLDKLFGAPFEKQAADLMKAVRNADDLSGQAMALAIAYRNGDLDKMLEIMNSDKDMSGDDMEKLIYSRNRSWVDYLLTALPTASMMIVVGVGHLPGEQGLLHLLSEKGYKLTPVNSEKDI